MRLSERRAGIQDLPTAEQLVAVENSALNPKPIEIPHPPQELLDVQARLKEKGIDIFEAHYLPDVVLEKDSQFPGWQVRPDDWFWETINAGVISEDAKRLPGMWILIDGRSRPNYERGTQMYANDPFAPILQDLRKEGRIKIPDNVKHVPRTSGFGVSLDEVESQVIPRVAEEILGIESQRVRVPKEIEFNVLGNLHHPEWGQTNTWEWLYDKLGNLSRLIGGHLDGGGLASVRDYYPTFRIDRIGFRLLAEFPQK